MSQRIIGFDLARAYAIFGMFIVNFNFSFGSILAPTDALGWFLSLFTGNSTAIFIICAGMGVVLMSNQANYSTEEKQQLKSKILKRSWFLFAFGLLLYNWWEGDILHFYGGYMHIAAFILLLPKRYFLLFFVAIIVIHNVLLLIIPIDSGWNFESYDYTDFWTPIGFLRNTLYNGWNAIFPWFSYFLLGMWLGKLDWQAKKVRRNVFFMGLFLFLVVQVLRVFAKNNYFSSSWSNYIMSDYFPPFLPFILVTIGFALMVISICMQIGDQFKTNRLVLSLQKTGQMTLTHYVLHLTVGVILFAAVTNRKFSNGLLPTEKPISSLFILCYALIFFAFCVFFSSMWKRKFKNGPLETIMRKISG